MRGRLIRRCRLAPGCAGQFVRRRDRLQPPVGTRDRGQRRCGYLIQPRPSRRRERGQARQSHRFAELSPFRRILPPSALTKPHQVQRDAEARADLAYLVNGEDLLAAQHPRGPRLRVAEHGRQLVLGPPLRQPDRVHQGRYVTRCQRRGNVWPGPEFRRQPGVSPVHDRRVSRHPGSGGNSSDAGGQSSSGYAIAQPAGWGKHERPGQRSVSGRKTPGRARRQCRNDPHPERRGSMRWLNGTTRQTWRGSPPR